MHEDEMLKNSLSAKKFVAGVDEAGRGPLAGPVVAAAVILGSQHPEGLDDSKKLSPKKRAILDQKIRDTCLWGIGVVDAEEIDKLNILKATMKAMTIALLELLKVSKKEPSAILIDGNISPYGRCKDWRWPKARTIIGGDATEPAISAASIVAKEWRDRIMNQADQVFPEYGWFKNKGYGTAEHIEAIKKHGPSPFHRRSFAPVSQLVLF